MLSKRNKLEEIVFQKGYTIDDDGNVYNPSGTKLSLTLKNGYYALSVKCKELGYSDSKKVKVHRLQAYKQFGNKIYEDDIVVRHLDGNSLNNRKDNIAIGTQRDNIYDMTSEARRAKSMNGAKGATKYSQSFVEKIRQEYASGKKYKQISEEYGLAKSTISFIINHKYRILL